MNEISIKINSMEYSANFQDILEFIEKDITLVTNEYVQSMIEKCAAWRETIWAKYCILKNEKDNKELEFEIFYADKEKEARDAILIARKNTAGKLTTTNSTVAREEIKNEIIRSFREDYENRIREINDLNSKVSLLYKTYENLVSRAMELQAILKSRKEPNNRW